MARAAIADANARALEAQAELARFKAPRSIDGASVPALISELSKFAGTDAAIYVLGNGPEPTGLGAAIAELLNLSHWKALTWNWSGAGAAVGVIVFFKPGSEVETDPACDAVVVGLNSIHIDSIKQPWPGDWATFGGMLTGPNPPSPTDAPIRIIIGTKPL